MNTYVIPRRSGWRAIDDVRESAKRAESALECAPDDVRWIRSYLLAEPDGCVGTVCVHEATSPEALRTHARRAGRTPISTRRTRKRSSTRRTRAGS